MTEQGISRRSLLAGALAGGGALALQSSPAGAARTAFKGREPFIRDGGFSLGVSSGLPNMRGTTIWTRVDGIEKTGRLRFEVARDEDFANVVYAGRARAVDFRDFTVRRRLNRLEPATEYWYRFFTEQENSPVGRFRTALPPDSREPVRIGFFSCQNYQAGYFTPHAGLRNEPDLDLVVCLGDYIYERTAAEGPPDRKDRTGVNRDSVVQTLDEYRQKYRLYRTDPNLRAVHANFPIVAIWDDHEAEDGYAAEHGDDDPVARRVPFLERRQNGYLAFFEYMPRIRHRPELNRTYQRKRLGSNFELFLLDTRQYRDDQAAGVGEPCLACDDPGRSLLGGPQKEWLKRSLANSRAAWKVIGNQVMMMGLDVPAGNPYNPDQWDGYAAERRELMEFALERGIEDIAVLTGDIHTFFAGDVTTTGRIDGTAAATEFVGGSVTSFGIPENLGANLTKDQVAILTGGGLRANNPHIKYDELSRRGYGVLEARPDELLVEFRAPRSTFEQPSPVETLKRFRVARGQPSVEPL